MARNVLFFDDVDAEDLSLTPETLPPGWLGAPGRTHALLDIPGAAGAIDSGIPFTEPVRSLAFTGLIDVDAYTDIAPAADVLKEALGGNLVALRGPYSTDRAFYGKLTQFDAQQFTDEILDGFARLAIAFTCPLPYLIATAQSTIGSITTTLVDIPLGTAPSRGRDDYSAIIEIVGAATTPVLTYADSSGATVGIMDFNGPVPYSPLAGDSIIIDLGRREVHKSVSGVITNALESLAVGYKFPALEPSDGNIASAAYPKLKVSAGTAVINYFLMWR